MLLYISIVAGSWIANRLSLRAAYAVASLAGLVGYMVSRRQRASLMHNLSVALSMPSTSPDVRRVARRAFQNNARNWMDSLRLETISRQDVIRRVDVEGWDLLAQAMEAGKGAIMIGAHLGNIDVVGQIMAARGVPLTIPVEVVKPEALFARTQRLRQSLGIRTIPAANSVRQLLRALRAGGVVGIMADRNLEEDGIEVQFFGRPTIVSRGPAWLATNCLAPVLCGTGIRRPDGTFSGTVTQVDVRRTGDKKADTRANAQVIMSEIEHRVREHPDQWCMFAPVWSE